MREASGSKQCDFAEAIDYGASHLSRVERGEVTPSREFVDACEAVLSAKGLLSRLYAAVLAGQQVYRRRLRKHEIG